MTRALANAPRWIPVTSTGMTTFVAWDGNSADVIPAFIAGIQPSATALDHWRPHTGQRRIEVLPTGVGLFDHIDLPSPRPLLHSLFTLDGFSHISELLEPDEAVDLVFAGEAGAFCGFVLLHTKDKAVSDPDIEGTSRFAGENINPITAHDTSYNLPTEYAARWIPVTSTGMTTFVAWHGNSADVIPAFIAGIQPSATALDQWRPHTGQRRIEVLPVRVLSFDQIDLPSPRPLLHSLFTLDCHARTGKFLEPYQLMEDVDPIAAHNTPKDLPTEYEARWIAGTSPAMTSAAREAS